VKGGNVYRYATYPDPKFLDLYNQKLRELQELIKSQGLSLQIAPGGKCELTDRKFLLKKGILNESDLPDQDRLQSYKQEYNQVNNEAERERLANLRKEDGTDFSNMGEVIEIISTPSPNDITITPYPADFSDLAPTEVEKLSCKRDAQLYAKFCTEALERLGNTKSRTVEWQRIAEDYNQKRMVPELYKLKGERKERALRIWLDEYISSKYNMYALINNNKHANRGRKVTYFEQNFLLNKLLNPNQIKIGSAITQLKSMANLKLCESPSDERTLRRWCQDWADNHPAEWAQARKGSKYVSERIIKSIIRDDSLLKVGDVWVADGHVLSFDIMNPATGKAQRMTMIMVMDWASRYPVGASLAFTEDSQHILAAFRNGFLNASILTRNNPTEDNVTQLLDNDNDNNHLDNETDNEHLAEYPAYHPDFPLAVLPKYVYLDNGRAFKSKLFNERWEDHDLSTELCGIFPRLNIGVTFAESYNAKAKIIERFFKTFQEQFERFIESFRGSSIPDKPANLMRNEVWAKKLFDRKPPTIEETMQLIAFYVRHMYGETPHSALKHRTPYQVFSNAVVQPDRQIEAQRLNFLMLAIERKSIRSEGIRLNHLLYWHEKLIDYIGKPCIIRFDFKDARWIMVYTIEDKFICQAELRRAQHSFIKLDMDNPIAHKDLEIENKHIKKMRKSAEQSTKKIILNSQEAVDRQIASLSQIASQQLEVADQNELQGQLFVTPPMISPPPKSPSQIIKELQQQVMDSIPERVEPDDNIEFIDALVNQVTSMNDKADKPDKPDTEATKPVTADTGNNEPQEDNLTPEGSLTETHTFEEMLHIIGIK
jgi:putative transposase